MDRLETNDIQHFLLARTPALAARYEFLTFRDVGRWPHLVVRSRRQSRNRKLRRHALSGRPLGHSRLHLERPSRARPRRCTLSPPSPTSSSKGWQRAPKSSASPAPTTPITGWAISPVPICTPSPFSLRAMLPERERCRTEHARYLDQTRWGRRPLLARSRSNSTLHLRARTLRLSRSPLSSLIEGVDPGATCGSEKPTKAGEFFLGYVDESPDYIPVAPQPEILSRNGSYIAYLRIEEHVGVFREFLREQRQHSLKSRSSSPRNSWGAGAAELRSSSVLTKDDPELAADPQRTNDFDYGKMDPYGYGCPVGSHMRRMNPRDTAESIEPSQDDSSRRNLRSRAAAEGVPDDGVERGIAAFVGCASLIRQFEFAMNVWTNDPNFKNLGNERDPFVGTQDGTFDYTIPKRPIKKKIKGLPAFTTIRGGAYFFLPGIRALRYLASDPQTRNSLQNEGELQWHN